MDAGDITVIAGVVATALVQLGLYLRARDQERRRKAEVEAETVRLKIAAETEIEKAVQARLAEAEKARDEWHEETGRHARIREEWADKALKVTFEQVVEWYEELKRKYDEVMGRFEIEQQRSAQLALELVDCRARDAAKEEKIAHQGRHIDGLYRTLRRYGIPTLRTSVASSAPDENEDVSDSDPPPLLPRNLEESDTDPPPSPPPLPKRKK